MSRCVVTLDSGISISWTTNPDGSYPGTEFHAQEEDSFLRRIDAQTPAIEALFDEMEHAGRRFLTPDDPNFYRQRQRASVAGSSQYIEQMELQVVSQPRFTEADLDSLARCIASLLRPPVADDEPPFSLDRR